LFSIIPINRAELLRFVLIAFWDIAEQQQFRINVLGVKLKVSRTGKKWFQISKT